MNSLFMKVRPQSSSGYIAVKIVYVSEFLSVQGLSIRPLVRGKYVIEGEEGGTYAESLGLSRVIRNDKKVHIMNMGNKFECVNNNLFLIFRFFRL